MGELKQKTKEITIKLGDIKAYDKNPYIHEAEDITELEYSINNFGYISKIVLWKGEILAGHARHIALMNKYSPNTPITVTDASYLNAIQAKKYRIMENESRRGKINSLDMVDEIKEIFPHGLENIDNIKYETGIDYEALIQDHTDVLNKMNELVTEPGGELGIHSEKTGQYILKFDRKDFDEVKNICLFIEKNDFIPTMSDIFLFLLKKHRKNYIKENK